MNFLRWMIDILLGWITHILKKIESGLKFKEINRIAEENRLFNKDFNDKYLWTALILILPLFMSETYIGQCEICQKFIWVMSTWIPGISLMSKESIIPNVVALEISIAWIMIFVIVAINLYRAWWAKTLFIPPENFTKKRVMIYLIGKVVFLFLEFLKTPISFYNGTIGQIHSNLRRNEVHDLLQFKLGVLLIAVAEVIWLSIVFIGFILVITFLLRFKFQKIN